MIIFVREEAPACASRSAENGGLPVPDVRLSETLTEDILSSITGDKISIGLGARLRHRLLGRWTMEETLLHELLHGLVDMKFPPKCVRDAFGDDEEWDQDQNLLRWLADPDDYVSRYAATHPEEDLIETAKAVLLGKPLGRRNAVKNKAYAIRYWFDRIRRTKVRKKGRGSRRV